MQSSLESNMKTFQANVYDIQGGDKIIIGTVVISLNEGEVDFTRLSDRATLEELKDVTGMSSTLIYCMPLFA